MPATNNPIMDPLLRELMNAAATGEAARMFLESDLGAYVTHRAAEEIDEAMADLCEVDPTDAKAVSALQVRIAVAKGAICYLTEALTAGQNAMRQLEENIES